MFCGHFEYDRVDMNVLHRLNYLQSPKTVRYFFWYARFNFESPLFRDEEGSVLSDFEKRLKDVDRFLLARINYESSDRERGRVYSVVRIS
jgi:hypothetical protein